MEKRANYAQPQTHVINLHSHVNHIPHNRTINNNNNINSNAKVANNEAKCERLIWGKRHMLLIISQFNGSNLFLLAQRYCCCCCCRWRTAVHHHFHHLSFVCVLFRLLIVCSGSVRCPCVSVCGCVYVWVCGSLFNQHAKPKDNY